LGPVHGDFIMISLGLFLNSLLVFGIGIITGHIISDRSPQG
jgi:hypothetical protein